MGVTEISLDVTKPHRPDIVKLSEELSKIEGVKEVKIIVDEMDLETESVKIIIRGENLDVTKIISAIELAGGAVQSIDEVVYKR